MPNRYCEHLIRTCRVKVTSLNPLNSPRFKCEAIEGKVDIIKTFQAGKYAFWLYCDCSNIDASTIYQKHSNQHNDKLILSFWHNTHRISRYWKVKLLFSKSEFWKDLNFVQTDFPRRSPSEIEVTSKSLTLRVREKMF